MSENRLAVAFDFDGVIHNMYDGWRDGSIYGSPNLEVIEAIKDINAERVPVFIFSTRSPFQVVEWWNRQKFGIEARVIEFPTFFFNDTDYIGVTSKKLPASVYVDDRAEKYVGQNKNEILRLVIGKDYV